MRGADANSNQYKVKTGDRTTPFFVQKIKIGRRTHQKDSEVRTNCNDCVREKLNEIKEKENKDRTKYSLCKLNRRNHRLQERKEQVFDQQRHIVANR